MTAQEECSGVSTSVPHVHVELIASFKACLNLCSL